jgi:chromosome segregation ATPase
VISDLNSLKDERRKLGGAFGTEASPARKINGFEKYIAHVTGKFPDVQRRFGLLSAESEWKESFTSLLKKDDKQVLKNAEQISSQIAEKELEIKKINAAISIDIEQSEIVKMGRAIQTQKQRISASEDAIADLERQIAETTNHIEELKDFIQSNGGINSDVSRDDHGSKD